MRVRTDPWCHRSIQSHKNGGDTLSPILPDQQELALTDLPGKSDDGSYIYVLQFASGVVKVGTTRNAAQRLRQHAVSALQHGGEIVAHWVSDPHRDAAANEQALINFCAERAERTTGGERGEYFSGLEFAPVVEFAKSLPFEPAKPVNAEVSDEQKEAFREGFARAFGRRFALPPRGQVPQSWTSSAADASLDLSMLSLDLPADVADRLDSEDRAQINENLLDVLHAMQEIGALKHFLSEAETRHDRALFDDRHVLRDRLAAKHGVTSPHGDRKTTAASLAEAKKQLDEERDLPPLQKLQIEMRRFNARTITAFEKEHDLTWNAPDRVFALHRGGIRDERTRVGDFVTMLTASDGRYAVEWDACVKALGMSEADFIGECEGQDDDFPVLVLASLERGVHSVELVLSAAMERIARDAGFGAPVEITRAAIDGGAA